MLIIKMHPSKRFGLEVWQVTINGVIAHEFLSREMAMTAFIKLKQRYSAIAAR